MHAGSTVTNGNCLHLGAKTQQKMLSGPYSLVLIVRSATSTDWTIKTRLYSAVVQPSKDSGHLHYFSKYVYNDLFGLVIHLIYSTGSLNINRFIKLYRRIIKRVTIGVFSRFFLLSFHMISNKCTHTHIHNQTEWIF